MKLLNILNKIIEYSFYLLFFAAPLLFNPSRSLPSFELFEWNKMVFVYLMTILITGAWIIKIIRERKINFSRTPLDIPILLFLISQSLSTLFSIDRHVSIFGYYSRFHGGLLSTICYILLYYAYISNHEYIKFKRLLMFIFSSGMIVAIYGILEKFGIDANMWVQDVRARVFSTLGQPNWLAAYLAILLPLSIAKMIHSPIFSQVYIPARLKTNSIVLNKIVKFIVDSGLFKNWFYWLTSILFYICLLFTRSRSGFLGFWGANMFFWTGLFIIYKPLRFITMPQFLTNLKSVINFRQKIKIIFSELMSNYLIKLCLVLNLLLILFNFIIRTPFPVYNRFLSLDLIQKQNITAETKAPIGDSVINVGITDSSNIRKIVWQGALDIAKNFPLFGTGPETFAYAYYKYRPVAHNLTSEWDFLYNKAHNEYLNFAATSGFLGLAIYLMIIIFIVIWSVKYILKSSLIHQDASDQISSKTEQTNLTSFENKKIELPIIILSLIASYISILITNFFGFSVVIVGLYFFLIPAFIFILALPKKNIAVSEMEIPQILVWQKISILVLFIVLIYAIINLSLYWIGDSFYARSISFTQQELYQQAYQNIQFATDLNSYEPNYHDQKATIASSLALSAYETKDTTLSAKLVLDAITESTKALKISPQNVNFWKTRTRILFNLSEINPAFTQSALDSIKVTAELAPTDARIAYNIAVIAGRANKFDEAIAALQKTIELKPDYRDAYIALSIFYTETGKKDKAREILNEALKKINPDDAEIKTRLEKL